VSAIVDFRLATVEQTKVYFSLVSLIAPKKLKPPMLKDGGLNNAVQRIFPYMAISANCDLACHTGRYFVVGQGASYRTASHFSSIATTSLIS
jgi:hypothetical protein